MINEADIYEMGYQKGYHEGFWNAIWKAIDILIVGIIAYGLWSHYA